MNEFFWAVAGWVIGRILEAGCGLIFPFFSRMFKISVHSVSIQTSIAVNYMTQPATQNLLLRVRNVGTNPLPPYRPMLYNRFSGTVAPFLSETQSLREANQIDVWKIVFNPQNPLYKMLRYGDGLGEQHRLSDEQFSEWTFRLVVEDTNLEGVLFENQQLGLTLASVLDDAVSSGQIAMNSSDRARLQFKPNWIYNIKNTFRTLLG